jgi:alkylation response protein AidB-like acyl-CoA dehydrogenase
MCAGAAPLSSHQDLTQKLAEVLVGVMAVAAVKGATYKRLGEAAVQAMCALTATSVAKGETSFQ